MSDTPHGSSEGAPREGSEPSPQYAPPPSLPPQYPPAAQYGQQPPWPPPPYYGYGPPVAARTNGFAIASLVLGILWLYWVGSILALIFGYIGKSQIDGSGGTQTGRGLAIAGIVLGWVGVGALLLIVVLIAIGTSATPY
jgi:Domain of unknown function (DUF4190)